MILWKKQNEIIINVNFNLSIKILFELIRENKNFYA